jgi:membrane protein DedA with SNARE-associated domain
MQHLIASYGYLAIFLLMVAESACIPVPSELTMTFGGALAAGAVAGAHLNLVLVIAVGVAGNVSGTGRRRSCWGGLCWLRGRF